MLLNAYGTNEGEVDVQRLLNDAGNDTALAFSSSCRVVVVVVAICISFFPQTKSIYLLYFILFEIY